MDIVFSYHLSSTEGNADKSLNADGPEDLPFFMSPPPAAKKKSNQQKQHQENAKKSNSKSSAAAKQDAEPSRHRKSQPQQR